MPLRIVILLTATAWQAHAGDTFKDSVQPFLKAHCLDCHSGAKPKGDASFAMLTGDLQAGPGLDAWIAIRARLKAGDMPPPERKAPEPAAIEAVTAWIDLELAKAGERGVIRAGNLRTGNRVPHDLLFGGKADAALDNPPRIWRISPFIYDEAAKQLKNVKLASPFSPPPGDGFKDQAGDGRIDESTLSQILRNAEAIVDDQLGLANAKGKKPHASLAPLLKDAPTAAEIDAAVSHQFDLMLKRKPTKEELERYRLLHAKALAAGNTETAARVVLSAVLLLPEATFRREIGIGDGPKKMLAPREAAFAIAYALTDKAPDAELLKAAETGKLATREQVAIQVKRLLAKGETPRVPRFFREYFGYANATEVFKDQKDFPGHDAKALVEDTDRLVLDILAKDRNVFLELMTTNKSYIAHKKADANAKKLADEIKKFEELKAKDPKKAAGKSPPGEPKKLIASAYNLATYTPSAMQPVELPATERAGILTQPSWLVAYSDNADNHAIRRGKWVRERLLGGTVPDLPITVDAQLPDAPHLTLRERMNVTRQEYCWQCHAKMNDIGLLFEEFDHFGRHRREETVQAEGGKTTKAMPLDATGRIDGTGDAAVDGAYKSSLEMIRKLARTDRARQVFIRHAFRYWMGRDENLGDAHTLQEADKAYLESGGSMNALLLSLLTSDSFLLRTEGKP